MLSSSRSVGYQGTQSADANHKRQWITPKIRLMQEADKTGEWERREGEIGLIHLP